MTPTRSAIAGADRPGDGGFVRALLVEDEFMVSMLVETYLRDLGVDEIVTASTFAKGLVAAETEGLSFAILDVNLNGTMSFPIAARLRERGVPITFQTGYGRKGVEEAFADCPVLAKPYTRKELRDALDCLLG